MSLGYQCKYLSDLFKRYGFFGLILKAAERRRSPMREYGAHYRRFLPDEAELKRQGGEQFSYMPLISIVVPAYETPPQYLTELLASVFAQSYENWELCIADASVTDAVWQTVQSCAKGDGRVRIRRLSQNGGISENTNAGIAMARGEYIALMDHDDLLAANALYEMVKCLNESYTDADRELALLYSDEDKINADGSIHSRPHFKPDYNPELLRRNNYFCHLLLFHAALPARAGGLKKEYDGAQDYDLVLRFADAGAKICHIPKILYHWRIHEGSTAGNSGDKAYAFDNGCRAIEAHLARNGISGRAAVTADLGVYQIKYCLQGEYRVTVAAEDPVQLKRIRKHYDSMQFQDKPYCLHIEYKTADSLYGGVARACTDGWLLYIRKDVRVSPDGLIETLLGFCGQKQTAAAGVKFITPRGRVASCGFLYDDAGRLIPLCGGLNARYKGYFLHASVPQNVSVVSFACVMLCAQACALLEKTRTDLTGIYRDADACFWFRGHGYAIVLTPEVTAVQQEALQQEDDAQRRHFFAAWERQLFRPDPCYSSVLRKERNHTYEMKRETAGETKDVFIIGSKGIPAGYGGFETFADQLTGGRISGKIRYHVACMAEKDGEFEYHKSRCFQLNVPPIGPAKAVWYDLAAFRSCLRYIRKHPGGSPVIYVLACRIGPFIGLLKRRLHRMGGRLFVNPDGHEWMRAKWNRAIRAYWRFSEKYMVKHADLLICDSKNIEAYILDTYKKYKPKTVFLPYGASIQASGISDRDEKLLEWYGRWNIAPGEYFLIVGRFVPENNYETMLREFMHAKTDKKLAVISNVQDNRFYRKLREATGFDRDRRILFCQTVYDAALLKKIRENACAYLHGHEVGGTNPSLLEALSGTDVNLLLDVGFNREVGEDAALYWTKQPGSLSRLIERAAHMDRQERDALGGRAKARIRAAYCPEQIAAAYERLFLGDGDETDSNIRGGRGL